MDAAVGPREGRRDRVRKGGREGERDWGVIRDAKPLAWSDRAVSTQSNPDRAPFTTEGKGMFL